MRLIDADALIEEIAKTQDLRTLSTKTIGEAIDRVPSVQKTGHWIPWKAYYGKDRKSWSDELKCSECRYKWGDEEYKYCPNCGARMVGEGEWDLFCLFV